MACCRKAARPCKQRAVGGSRAAAPVYGALGMVGGIKRAAREVPGEGGPCRCRKDGQSFRLGSRKCWSCRRSLPVPWAARGMPAESGTAGGRPQALQPGAQAQRGLIFISVVSFGGDEGFQVQKRQQGRTEPPSGRLLAPDGLAGAGLEGRRVVPGLGWRAIWQRAALLQQRFEVGSSLQGAAGRAVKLAVHRRWCRRRQQRLAGQPGWRAFKPLLPVTQPPALALRACGRADTHQVRQQVAGSLTRPAGCRRCPWRAQPPGCPRSSRRRRG